ncbi:hypothetical protein [uncultured Chryseobacterium sp.]|uniref:hypothetical protein n=1 Tax=uncultured Chryseobacterium sp. TaxID=259322 RepID=UPI003747BA30
MNKKILIGTSIVSSILAFSQQTISVNQVTGSQAVFNTGSDSKPLRYEDISGSPYMDKKFHEAKVADQYEKIPVRYNSYKDEVEFEKNGSPLVLPKETKFSRIEIASPKQTIVLLETNDDLSGYFLELVNGKNTLYKKVKTKFIDAIPAPNGYTSDKPATFKTLAPVYYVKTEKGFIKNPKNLKDITEQFPEKKEALAAFFKSNRIKLDKEEDIIRLVNFLNQN